MDMQTYLQCIGYYLFSLLQLFIIPVHPKMIEIKWIKHLCLVSIIGYLLILNIAFGYKMGTIYQKNLELSVQQEIEKREGHKELVEYRENLKKKALEICNKIKNKNKKKVN